MVGGGSGKLVKFQQHTRKKPEDEKTQLNLATRPFNIRLVSSYSTVSQNSGGVLRIFWQFFFTFFTKFFGKFWSAGSSHKPTQKTSPVPLVYVPISLINIPFTNIQKFLVSRKNVKSVCLCTDCKKFQFNGTVEKFWV